MHERKCPDCNKTIIYAIKLYRDTAEKHNKKCKSCAQRLNTKTHAYRDTRRKIGGIDSRTLGKIPSDAIEITCDMCKKTQPVCNFRMNKSRGQYYYRHTCKGCLYIDYSKRTEAPKLRASRLCASAIQRTKENIKKYKYCDLTPEWIQERIENEYCVMTGIKFVLTGGRHPFSPSLDRIDSTKGYTKDNVQLVTWMYNTAKGQFTHDDVLIMAHALLEKHVPIN